ncbi:ammonium transporter : Ammonium transporter OS=Leptospira alexanderi serovar Manhao 3 str. L 60 GN=amt_2 PE=4 SV=1: Ammonium_transp [Gemmata massiliana]|uniref:Ammonium transporter AmtB-like domain-containing protein n=1 Tax=Gemmata massiliana TaxID=1210884 RepID=A0A6P2D8B9_9BACT|nr:ammonium transporter [Gemmata massiliana]VTR95762.1 ammonium transporter : Ammonium transporter OS=Leptospira alexanderi serovar Manhao 3 str. L 60 GN=amt_2 PE=4 SV=1: Ammonium_transp [Gemmata massiliana]
MQVRRLSLALLLFAGCSMMPGLWAPMGGTASAQDEKKSAAKSDLAAVEKSIADLKKAFDATEKELANTKKALGDLKTSSSADAKAAADKVTALKKEIDAATATATTTKKDLDAITAKANALATELAAVKAAGGDPKAAADKLTALEKGAEELKKTAEKGVTDAGNAATAGKERGDTAWMLTSSAFVLFMVPGLALFYGGMVRRKNVLATMMHSMAALAVVGVYWVAIGYALAFGTSVIQIDFLGVEKGGLFGWSWDLVFLKGIEPGAKLPGYDIPVYVHVMFQGMFAIITPALISGAIAERIRFWPFCLFMLLWVTFVYCPLAHMVWAFDWFDSSVLAAKRGGAAIGLLGKMGALDFAGGTVVHIAAGMAGLACCLVLGKRAGYPKQIAHPNSMVLTLLGAGLLWFGWFGFNGGSSVRGDALAGSAFAATQAAAAAAGLGWLLVEWLHKGKPTALGLASGIVAGLVAVTPASGFVYMWGAVLIGLAAAVLCYLAVALKNVLGYDDSLDAFGVHGVGGFVGAILTGVFCSTLVNPAGTDGPFAFSAHRSRLEALKKDDSKLIAEAKAETEKANKAAEEAEAKVKAAPEADKASAEKALTEAKDIATDKAATQAALEKELSDLQALADKQDDKANDGKDKKSGLSQVIIQIKASLFSVGYAFVLSIGLVLLTQAITLGNFKTDARSEAEGLDRTEHGEVGFDFSGATESVTVASAEPRPASVPRGNGRFDVQITGADPKELMAIWSELCKPTDGAPDKDFIAVYPHVTTIRGTTFRCRDGDAEAIAKRLSALFTRHTKKPVTATKV